MDTQALLNAYHTPRNGPAIASTLTPPLTKGERLMKITLTRVEGKAAQAKCEDFHDADIVLTTWSRTAPKDGGYDKCDFTVEFDNGDVYEGQYDLVHPSVGGLPDLRKHIREALEWMAAERAAPYLPEEYRREAAEMLKQHRDVLAVF